MEALTGRGGTYDPVGEDLYQVSEIIRRGDRYSDRVRRRSRAPQQTGQHAPGPELDECLHAFSQQGVKALAPADGAAQL